MPVSKNQANVITFSPPDEQLWLNSGAVEDEVFSIIRKYDRLKQLKFDISQQSTPTILTLRSGAITGNTTITLPSAAGTIALTSDINPASVTLSGSTIDWSQSALFKATLTGNMAYTMSNLSEKSIVVALTNSGSFTASFTGVSWPSGAAPVQTASLTDVYTFVKIGSTIYGSVVQGF